MKIWDVPQGTSAWHAVRFGIPTSSCFDKIITPGGKAATSAEGYMNHLLAERILGRVIDGYKSAAMEHGNDYEEKAVSAYEFTHNLTARKIGFVTTDDGLIGCSPDRFLEEHPEGQLQAKAPTPDVHMAYLRASTGASKAFKVQLQGEMWVCEKEWNQIISYCPGFPDAEFRVYRDAEFIKELSAHVRSFARQLDEISEDFKARGWIRPPEEQSDPETDAAFLNQADVDWAVGREYQEARG